MTHEKNNILNPLLFISLCAFAHHHKTDVKGGKIIVEGEAVAKIEKYGCRAFSANCKFYISNLQGKRLITIYLFSYNDPTKITRYDTTGTVNYLRFAFAGYSKLTETDDPAAGYPSEKRVARLIISAQLIKDGKLNKPAVLNFIKINGMHFSDRQKALGKQPQIIIINSGK